MASIYSTGPALIYVGAQGTAPGQAKYLGTFERKPEIEIRKSYVPVMNDLGGSELPTDYCYEGQEGTVSGVMNRFNMNTLRALEAQPASIVAGGAVNAAINEGGDTLGGSYGALMNQDNLGVLLYVVFSRLQPGNLAAAVTALQNQGMPAGYMFLSSFLQGPIKKEPGTGDFKETVIFKCIRKIVVNAQVGATGMNLYQTLVAAPSVPIID